VTTRTRPHVMLTLDPEVHAAAKVAAAEAGLPFSRWVEQLIRAALVKRAKLAAK
jgi:predicted HicB family RNase H-like nuclease